MIQLFHKRLPQLNIEGIIKTNGEEPLNNLWAGYLLYKLL